MKENYPYQTDYDKLNIKSWKVSTAEIVEANNVLGRWYWHPEKGLSFARSRWQGD
jgi:hypothetical protein